MIWTKIKLYWKVALPPLLIFGGFLLRLSGARSAANKLEAKSNKARLEHAKEVMEQDKVIEREHDARTEDLAKEVKEKKTSSELSDPNQW